VIKDGGSADDAPEDRPRSHWVAITAAFTLVIWVPLSVVALGLGRRLAAMAAGARDVASLGESLAHASRGVALLAVVALVAPVVIAFVTACFFAAAVTGRYGGRAKIRDAAIGTTLAAFAAFLLALAGGSLRPWPVALATLILLGFVALLFGALGGRFGFRRRPRL
jgi:hypothetical protein